MGKIEIRFASEEGRIKVLIPLAMTIAWAIGVCNGYIWGVLS